MLNYPKYFIFFLSLVLFFFHCTRFTASRQMQKFIYIAVVVTGGSSISLTYIASERIIPGYVCYALFASLFSLKSCHLSLGDGALDIFYSGMVEV